MYSFIANSNFTSAYQIIISYITDYIINPDSFFVSKN